MITTEITPTGEPAIQADYGEAFLLAYVAFVGISKERAIEADALEASAAWHVKTRKLIIDKGDAGSLSFGLVSAEEEMQLYLADAIAMRREAAIREAAKLRNLGVSVLNSFEEFEDPITQNTFVLRAGQRIRVEDISDSEVIEQLMPQRESKEKSRKKVSGWLQHVDLRPEKGGHLVVRRGGRITYSDYDIIPLVDTDSLNPNIKLTILS